jgi:CheY-like chemotaxis protein
MEHDLTILIAEDDESYSFFLQRAFRDIPLQTPPVIVADGEDAIAYLEGSGQYADRQRFPFPSLLFLDLKMPRAGGFDVLRWMQKHPEHRVIPTTILSGSSLQSDIDRAFDLGAQAYVTKPNDLDGLRKLPTYACEFWAASRRPTREA